MLPIGFSSQQLTREQLYLPSFVLFNLCWWQGKWLTSLSCSFSTFATNLPDLKTYLDNYSRMLIVSEHNYHFKPCSPTSSCQKKKKDLIWHAFACNVKIVFLGKILWSQSQRLYVQKHPQGTSDWQPGSGGMKGQRVFCSGNIFYVGIQA